VIDHVNFQMPERVARECLAFYELLGFTNVYPPESLRDRAIWLASGSTMIHLQFAHEVGDSGPGHVALVVPKYEATLGMLATAGVTVEPRAEHWGSPRCYVSDPAGNRLELMEFSPLGSSD
jgi:catechol 2,3-dioxygenase-like lactoylglutathione lyase family enzyme